MLTFVLPTEKRLVVSFWTFFSNISATKANKERTETTKKFGGEAGLSFFAG